MGERIYICNISSSFYSNIWYSIKISTNDIYYVFTQLMSVYSLFPRLNSNTTTVTKVLLNT